jgi:uncharacterized protein YutE (UPF0331/DUF86 family)
MVSIDKVRQKLLILEQNLVKLEKLKMLSQAEFLDDFRNVETTKHLLQVSVEIMIDISDHIVARNRLGTPETSAEAFEILCANGIIKEENVKTYITMTKFRNKVVHLYADIDDVEIYRILNSHLLDFRKFIKEVVDYVM